MLRKFLFNVTRKAAGAHVNGKWVAGADTTYELRGNLQPLTDKEMLTLPEGRRGSSAFKIFSDIPMQYANVQTHTNSDTLLINGVLHECIASNPWQNGIRSHYKNIVAKAVQ